MRFGSSNVRSLYSPALFTAADRELARYKLDLAGKQDVRGNNGSTLGIGVYNIFYGT